MKKISPAVFPYLILGLGGLGMASLRWLLTAGVEGSGLLIPWHPGRVGAWGITALTLLVLLLHCRRCPKTGKYTRLFPPSLPALSGSVTAAVAVFVTCLGHLMERPNSLNTATDILGILAVPVLIYTGWCRYQGKCPSFLLDAFLVIFLSLRLFCQYRSWAFNPQWEYYAFHLLGQICLILTAYERGAFAVRMGNPPKFTLYSLASVYFCCVALARGQHLLYWLGMGAWAFTGLCDPNLREEPHEAA